MMERTGPPGRAVTAVEKAAVALSSASIPSNRSQWVTSRQKCRQSIAIGFSHGVGRQVREDEPARGAAHRGLDLLVLVRAGVSQASRVG